MESAHETLPTKIKTYIKKEDIAIFYLNLKNILGFLYTKNIWINENINLYKQRFAICHELWHYYYQDDLEKFWKSHWKSPEEKRADEYAMNILLPKKDLLEEFEKFEWDLTILEKIFWVESKIIEKRLKNIL